MDWTGKVAVVTGGASGIGAASVREFCAEGATAWILDINVPMGDKLAAQLRSEGYLAEFRELNVSDSDRCRKQVDEIALQSGGVHCLVNSAVSFLSRGLRVTTEEWEQSLGVNVRGGANMAQACYPHMKSAGGGAIVNISSISGHIAQADRWTYNACKGAILSLTRCQALDMAPDKIRVNSVSPGWTWTPEVEKAAVGGREKWEPLWGNFSMMRRIGEAREVARAILFLCSDDASFITGADLPVDGGYLGLGSEGLGDHSTFAGSK